METELAANIRKYRKERKLTQEQLAEVMGVTTGAVHKWESGLSLPELNLIMQLADFFDISVDALLGQKMDPEALSEAEKALKKYPHSFDIVYCCSIVYLIYGTGRHNEVQVRRALALLEQALILLPQNTNPEISELSIYGKMAGAYTLLGEHEKAVELLKKHNVDGIFCDDIGTELALYMKRPKEAGPYLSEALLRSIGTLFNTIPGLYAMFCAQGNYQEAEDVILWAQEIMTGLRKENTPDFLYKTRAMLLILLADIRLKKGLKKEAEETINEAVKLTADFDSSLNYSANSIRFISMPQGTTLHDGLGATAEESNGTLISMLDNKELSVLWEKKLKKGRKSKNE